MSRPGAANVLTGPARARARPCGAHGRQRDRPGACRAICARLIEAAAIGGERQAVPRPRHAAGSTPTCPQSPMGDRPAPGAEDRLAPDRNLILRFPETREVAPRLPADVRCGDGWTRRQPSASRRRRGGCRRLRVVPGRGRGVSAHRPGRLNVRLQVSARGQALSQLPGPRPRPPRARMGRDQRDSPGSCPRCPRSS